jgi:hypothetical protein
MRVRKGGGLEAEQVIKWQSPHGKQGQSCHYNATIWSLDPCQLWTQLTRWGTNRQGEFGSIDGTRWSPVCAPNQSHPESELTRNLKKSGTPVTLAYLTQTTNNQSSNRD